MKGQAFHKRLGYAWHGLLVAQAQERSFRVQLMLGGVALLVTIGVSPPLHWLALVVVMISLVLGAELFNTALEQMLDGLHPTQAEFVRIAKDCAAAAVLVFSTGAVIVFGLMLCAMWG